MKSKTSKTQPAAPKTPVVTAPVRPPDTRSTDWPKGRRVRYTGSRVKATIGQAGVITGYRGNEGTGLWVRLDSGKVVSFSKIYAELIPETPKGKGKGKAAKAS